MSEVLSPGLGICTSWNWCSRPVAYGSFLAIIASGAAIHCSSHSRGRLVVTPFRSGPTRAPLPTVWQATHFFWNICWPACASVPAAFATVGSAAHMPAIVATATMDSHRRDARGFSLMIRRPQIYIIGGGKLMLHYKGLSLVIRRPSDDRRRKFKLMLDGWLENARGNTYFFRILSSAGATAELEARRLLRLGPEYSRHACAHRQAGARRCRAVHAAEAAKRPLSKPRP